MSTSLKAGMLRRSPWSGGHWRPPRTRRRGLARLYREQQRAAEAEESYRRALAILESNPEFHGSEMIPGEAVEPELEKTLRDYAVLQQVGDAAGAGHDRAAHECAGAVVLEVERRPAAPTVIASDHEDLARGKKDPGFQPGGRLPVRAT